MDRYAFAVRDQLFCVWGHDLARMNDLFLRSYDRDYFDYVTTVHVTQLEDQAAARAAVALRTAFHHAMETLLSLLGALSQAPDCVAAWLPNCSNATLRRLVDDMLSGTPLLTQRGRQRISFQDLSKFVHSHVWLDEDPPAATAGRFATFWERVAREFLNDAHTAEYNSIKHGFRASSGPFVMRVGLEHEYAVPPPEQEMQTIGASPHGTTFYVAEPLSPSPEARFHLKLKQQRLNWRAEAMAQAVQLLSLSIANVVGALRILGGAKPSTIRFHRPENPDAFEAPWRWSVGVTETSMELSIDLAEVVFVSRKQLLSELESRATGAA